MIQLGVVQLGPNLPGKEEGATDADRADGVELVRVKEDAGLQALRSEAAPEAVGADAAADCGPVCRAEAQLAE